jgi:hypothetical protein
MTRTLAPLIALSLLPMLGACNRSAAPTAQTTPPSATTSTVASAPETILGRSVEKGMVAARRELETGNIDLGDGPEIQTGKNHHFRIGRATDGSKAQLTPQGDLLIEGKAVDVTPAQRALLLDYRRQIIAVAETGMAIGVKGADLAGKAVADTFAGLMHGNVDAASRQIEAEGKRLETDARQICAQLPGMMRTQQQLAASLPAFKPYATLDQSDIDGCMKGDGAAVTDGSHASVRDEIRNEIRNRIRNGVRGAAPAPAAPASTATPASG